MGVGRATRGRDLSRYPFPNFRVHLYSIHADTAIGMDPHGVSHVLRRLKRVIILARRFSSELLVVLHVYMIQ